jgi:hypothetical protein
MDMLSIPQPDAGLRQGFPACRPTELAVSADMPMMWADNPTDVIEQLDSPHDVASLFEVLHVLFLTVKLARAACWLSHIRMAWDETSCT